jgi:hypothetical protein
MIHLGELAHPGQHDASVADNAWNFGPFLVTTTA